MNIPAISRVKNYFRYQPCGKVLVSEYDKFAKFHYTDEQITQQMQHQLSQGNRLSNSQKKCQRVADLTIASLLVAPLGIVSGLCAGIQKLANPDFPLLFRQARVGLNGKMFDVFKIQTLKYSPSNERLSSGFSRFLRKHSIDEFPQILNVFKGDMSFFGPRPIRVKEMNEAVNAVGEEFLERYNYKPGFGYGQIAEKISPLSRRKIEKNVFEHASLTDYAKTIFKLVKNVIVGDNK